MRFISVLNDTGSLYDDRFIVELTRNELNYLVENEDVDHRAPSYAHKRLKAYEEISTEKARKAHDRNRDIAFAVDKVLDAQKAFRIVIGGDLIEPTPTQEEK